MPYFPDRIMPLSPKKDAPGSHPDSPISASDYNLHDEQLQAFERWLLSKDSERGELRERVLALLDRANAMIMKNPVRVTSGHALSGTKVRFPRADVCFLKSPGAVSPSDRTIHVDSTTGFPEEGVISIINDVIPGQSDAGGTYVEWIRYSGKTSDSFLNCERGLFGTTAGTHSRVYPPISENQPSCVATPLQTVRPICPPPLIWYPFNFNFFGYRGDIEEIEQQIALEGASGEKPDSGRTFSSGNIDYDAFRAAMGAAGPPDPIESTFSQASKNSYPNEGQEIISANGLWRERWIPDWSAHRMLADDAEYRLRILDESYGTISELAHVLRAASPTTFAAGSPGWYIRYPAMAIRNRWGPIWHNRADGSGFLRMRRRERKYFIGGSVRRTNWYDDPIWYNDAVKILKGNVGLPGSPPGFRYNYVRPVSGWAILDGRLVSQDPVARAQNRLTTEEAHEVMLASVRAGIVDRFGTIENIGGGRNGVPVFRGIANVSAGMGSWSQRGKDRGTSPTWPRIALYADGTVFLYLDSANDFSNVGQSTVNYSTWVQPY